MTTFKNHLANIISLANVACGFFALISLMEGRLVAGMLGMALATFFDFIDGSVAAKLGAKNDLGGTIDMLADVISMGLLGGVGLYLFFTLAPWDNFFVTAAAWIGGIGYTITGLLREIRFFTNQCDRERSQGFLGLPIGPPSGFNVAIMGFVNLFPGTLYTPFILVLVLIMAGYHAYLMIFSEQCFYRWRKRGLLWQFGLSLIAGIVAYSVWSSFGLAAATFFIGLCLIYIYAHLFSALLRPFSSGQNSA